MKLILLLPAVLMLSSVQAFAEPTEAKATPLDPSAEPMQSGKFQATWKSLEQYKVPEWYQNAKFGIWAHWGPQCEAEDGDWYARNMYIEGTKQYKDHLRVYGHPSVAGFKDIIHEWKAENWAPEKLLALYKECGAKFFMALANHHDNFDTFDSKYQPWNSVNIGPKKDLIGGCEREWFEIRCNDTCGSRLELVRACPRS